MNAQLSDTQNQIFESLKQGKTPETIARELNTSESLVRANMTRIETKGVKLPSGATSKAPAKSPLLAEDVARPAAGGLSENDRIANELRGAGQALTADQVAALADQIAGKQTTDINPMLVMGCTIQFVRFVGGRMVAHQVIEDVYGALRAMCGGTLPEDKGGETVPLPQTDRERLEFLEKSNQELLAEIAKLKTERGGVAVGGGGYGSGGYGRGGY